MCCNSEAYLFCVIKGGVSVTQAPIIVWFRRDFRFSDQEALSAAHSTGRPIIPVFIFDEVFEEY